MEPLPFTLFDYQVPHVNRLVTILTGSPFVVDLSPMGSGKTFTAMALYHMMNFDYIVVVCPATLEEQWKRVFLTYFQIDSTKKSAPIEVFSYETFRGSVTSADKSDLRNRLVGGKSTLSREVKHGYLIVRYTFSKRGEIESLVSEYFPTKKLETLFETKRVLLIYDESHRVKNATTSSFSSVKTVVDMTVRKFRQDRMNSPRNLFLTGTLFDKPEFSFSFGSMFNFVTVPWAKRLIRGSSDSGKFNVTNFYREVFAELLAIAKKASGDPERITGKYATIFYIKTKEEALRLGTKILIEDVIPFIGAYMSPEKKEFRRGSSEGDFLDCKNQFVKFVDNIKDKNPYLALVIEKYETALDELKLAVESYKNADFVLAMIGKLMKRIESLKVTIFLILTLRRLKQTEKSKVVVAMNFVENVVEFFNLMKQSGNRVEMISGQTPKQKRADIISEFQSPDLGLRVIVTTMRVISLGVDLDDKHGEFPRWSFVSPSYFAIDQHQYVRRFYRAQTKGTAHVYFIYLYSSKDEGKFEMKMLSSITTKSDIMKMITDNVFIQTKESEKSSVKRTENRIKYLTDYPSEVIEI